MIVEQTTIVQNTHQCEKNIDTQFIDESSECGDGILDRVTSSGEGRTTSDGQCRIIA
jgi:hypothetical protein